MKKLPLLLCIALCSSLHLCGQGLKIKVGKTTFTLDEVIFISFETGIEVDSIIEPDFSTFEIVSGPNKSSSLSINNGIKTSSYKISYELRAIKPGKIKITSPVICNKNEKIKGEEISIEVTGKDLTKEELKAREFERFRKFPKKPEGTKRFLIKDDMGYIEVYGEKEWQYLRDMTKQEIQLLKKMD